MLMRAANTAFLPQPWQLAALDCVLCLYPAAGSGVLGGWRRATRMQLQCGVDNQGIDEALLFLDAQGRCCWRLQLLPDGDFLAWDRLCAGVGIAPAESPVRGACERWHRRVLSRLRGEAWRGAVLRFHAVASDVGHAQLAASLAEPSAIGQQLAARLMRSHGIES